MKVVSSQDGDLEHIENIVSEESLELYKKNNLCAYKRNATSCRPYPNFQDNAPIIKM